MDAAPARCADAEGIVPCDAVDWQTLAASLVALTPLATIVIDAHRRIVMRNAAAAALLSRGDGILDDAGVLAAKQAADDLRLRGALGEAAVARATGEVLAMAVRRDPQARPYGLRVFALPGVGASLFVACVGDPEAAPVLEPDCLRRLLDLTTMQARVTARLAAGRSVEEAAADLAVADGTVRVHLRNIFARLGINRQTRLVQLALASAASIDGAALDRRAPAD